MSDYSLELIGNIISINETQHDIGRKLSLILEEIKNFFSLTSISYYIYVKKLEKYLTLPENEDINFKVSEKVFLKGDLELFDSDKEYVLNIPVKDSLKIYGVVQSVRNSIYTDKEIKLLTLISRQISEYIRFHRVNENVQLKLETFSMKQEDNIENKKFIREVLDDIFYLTSEIFTQSSKVKILKYISVYFVFSDFLKVSQGIFYFEDKKQGKFKPIYMFNKKKIPFINFRDAMKNINKIKTDKSALKKLPAVLSVHDFKTHFKDWNIYPIGEKANITGYFLCPEHIEEINVILRILSLSFKNFIKITSLKDFGKDIDKIEKRLIDDNITRHYGEIVNQISHEIKNPLVVISGFASRIVKHVEKNSVPDKEYIKKSGKIIVEESLRLENLLHDSIIYNRTSVSVCKFKPISLFSIIKKCINLLKPQLEEREIELIFNYKKMRRVYGDNIQIRQLFFNVILNAVEAVKNNGKIIINLFPGKKYAIIEVEDNGQGIPQNILHNIFNPFFTTKMQGSGLGLAIVYRIVNNHNGLITVQNMEKGVKFTIKLPFQKDGR